MKRLFLLLMFAVVALSCEEIQDFIDPKGHGLVFLEGEMKAYFDDKGDTKNYKFQADLAWSAEVSADWVEVDPTSGPAGENKIKIKVDKNKSDEKRTGYVDITLSNDKSYRIELEQLAAGENLDDVIQPTNSCPSNEIWYTSADGNIVEPYSGEGSQDNFAVFGANIVSNTFDAEKECWVIKFDGDVTSIGDAAFYNCSSLTSVTIPDGVTTIGDLAFAYCSSLREFNGKYASEDGRCLIIDGTLNSFAPAGLTEYTIPDSVTTIGEWAFYDCSSLTSVTIPDSVTTIGDYAFRFCSSLTSVTIPDSVTEMGNGVFIGCCSLTRFNGKFTSDNGRCLIVDGTFNSFAPAGLTEYTIPDSVTTIGQDAFAYCSSLTSVTIGNSVIQIGGNAFYGCQNIQAVYISDLLAWCNINFECHLTEVVSIAANPLYCGANLYLNGEVVTDLVVPDGVTEIRMMSFLSCSSLTSITIPDSVTEIGYAAFAGCSRLTIAYCKSVTPPTALFDNRSYLWNGFSQNAIYVPMESVEAYKSAEGWSEYADAIVGYDFDSNNTETDMAKPANNEIWYTSSDGNIVEPCSDEDLDDVNILSVFGANIISNAYDAEKECWVIKFDGDVTTIGDYAFSGCSSLTSITIPDSVTTIGNSAFSRCSSLRSVTIGDGVTTIGNSAFRDCISLTSVTILDSVTSIGEGAFAGCSNLREFNGKYASEDGICLIIDGTLNSFAPAGLTEYTIPDSVTTIGDYAFSVCRSLTSVTIPDSVTTIGVYAFAGCNSLTSVTIGDSVTTIGDSAFYVCSSLTSVTIPDSVTTIGYYAFSECYILTSVYCKAVTPPAGGYGMFGYNASGRKIYVPTESVEAYKSANGWSDYADAIVGYNFETGEVDDTEKPEEPELSEYVIEYTSTDGDIVVPYDIMAFDATIVSNVYKDGKGMLCFDREVTTIGEWAFSGSSNLTSVTIPDSVTAIGYRAFRDCSSLTSVTIPDSVTSIGAFAFEGCSSLRSVTIGESVTEIEDGAFERCSSLTNATIPDSITRIGDLTFSGCSSLTSITIPDSVTTIGNLAFRGCSSLTSVTIPDSVTTIRWGAFEMCTNLISVTIGDSVTTIGDLTFSGCSSLTSVTIGDSVTTIGEGAFCVCDSLTSITIPDSVTTIGWGAFYNCSSLTSVYCKAVTPPVGDYSMFSSNASGRKIYVPTESVEAYKSAEYWSDYADAVVGYDF